MGLRDDYARAEFPRRRLLGRVERAELVGTGPNARHSYEFDAVDVEISSDSQFSALYDLEDRRHFALLRVITTERQFEELSGVAPQPGFWYSLDIAPTGRGPIVFHAQLAATGYSLLSRGTLQSAAFLFDEGTLGGGPDGGPIPGGGGDAGYLKMAERWPARDGVSVEEEVEALGLQLQSAKPATAKQTIAIGTSLGAAVTDELQNARALAAECGFPQQALTDGRTVGNILAASPAPYAIRVNDVGQASFATLTGHDGRPLMHYDVGWPVAFNGKTAPQTFVQPNEIVPVVISHWDYDHISGFYRFPQLQRALWIAPVQRLGPGGRKIAATLARRSLLLGLSSAKRVSWRWGELLKCSGLPNVVNQSGLALAVRLMSGKKALLVGDADYDTIGLPPGSSFDYLAVTHHGALFSGSVPLAAAPAASSVISVGRGNVYRHPKEPAIKLHERAHWNIERTAGTRRRRRGDRMLGP